MENRQIISNRIITPDGTVLESVHRHDYNEHTDANGLLYAVDGGRDYLARVVQNDAPYTEASVYTDSPFEEIREVVRWGTFGKGGDEPKRYVILKDMSNAHIAAILETQHHIPDWLRGIFEGELYHRAKNDINIED